MGFESGVVSLTMYYLPNGLPQDYVDRFAARALPPVDTLGSEAIHGWVTGRHLLDSNINEETAHVANRPRLTLAKAERKIPDALLRAHTRMEELSALTADGREFLDRKTRSEIRGQVTERLLPTMPPTLTGIPIAYIPSSRVLYAGATSDKQIDALTLALREALGVDPVPVTPETAALKRSNITVRNLPATSFSPECDDELAGGTPGCDFLTWLWFFFEERGGMLGGGETSYAVMIEGPLVFYMEGSGAHLTVLRDGAPLVASEAKAALLGGKKLRRARVTLARGEESWTATVDADTFVFRGVKLPKGEALDAVSRFEERMMSLERMREGFLTFYDRFVAERTNPATWSETRAAIHAWVSGRIAKA